jgi:hypothetical protein
MEAKRGERVGWTAGWMGGFVWVFVLSLVFLLQGKIEQGDWGIVVTAVAVMAILFFAPWRFPSTPYWKLMLAPYGIFLVSIVWAVWSYGGLGSAGLQWWDFLWLVPLLILLGIFTKKKWADAAPAEPGR